MDKPALVKNLVINLPERDVISERTCNDVSAPCNDVTTTCDDRTLCDVTVTCDDRTVGYANDSVRLPQCDVLNDDLVQENCDNTDVTQR